MDPTRAKNIGVSRKEMIVHVARAAMERSPYTIPNDLEKVLRVLDDTLSKKSEYMNFRDYDDLYSYLKRTLSAIPEVRAWTFPKNKDVPAFWTRDPDHYAVSLEDMISIITNRICIERAYG